MLPSVLLLGGVLAGCPRSDPAPAPDSGSTAGTPAGCSAPQQCVELPAWNGPVAVQIVAASDPEPTCDGFGTFVFDLWGGLSAPPATCGCACGGPTEPVACPETATLEQFDSNVLNCMIQEVASSYEIVEGCTDIPYFDDVSFQLEIDQPDLSEVTCEVQPTVDVLAADWTARLVGCALPEPLTDCLGGTCVPPSIDEASVCIWTEGTTACPAGPFSLRSVVYESFADSRGCSECSCGDAVGTCTGVATLRAGESCTVASPAYGPQEECLPIETPARSVEFAYDPLTVTCSPSEPYPVGEAAGTDAITVCCLE